MLKSVTVVGRGTAGIMAIKFLQKFFPETNITWIYPENNNYISVGEALVPASSKFIEDICINHNFILKETEGTIKCGLKMVGWNKINTSFNLPFENDSLMNIYMNKDMFPNNFISFKDLAHHFNTAEFQKMKINENKNLKIIHKEITGIDDIQDEIIFDCTGFKSPFKKKFISVADELINDNALVIRIPIQDKWFNPYATFFAKEYGWCWTIPLQSYISIGYVNCSKYKNKVIPDFIDHLKEHFNYDASPEDFKQIDMKCGYVEQPIEIREGKTIISCGLSGFFIEPLQSTGLFLICMFLESLLEYFNGEQTREYINEHFVNNYKKIKQFILNHFILCDKTNEYWDTYKKLDFKDKLFNQNGLDNDIFDDFFEQLLYDSLSGKKGKYKNRLPNNGGVAFLNDLKPFKDILTDFIENFNDRTHLIKQKIIFNKI